tara:strand:+ start:3799 stop:3969 length:171 start_codon:yes stop_codon:yes gene_type:complete
MSFNMKILKAVAEDRQRTINDVRKRDAAFNKRYAKKPKSTGKKTTGKKPKLAYRDY